MKRKHVNLIWKLVVIFVGVATVFSLVLPFYRF